MARPGINSAHTHSAPVHPVNSSVESSRWRRSFTPVARNNDVLIILARVTLCLRIDEWSDLQSATPVTNPAVDDICGAFAYPFVVIILISESVGFSTIVPI